jgi:hypothetical protein
MRCLKGRRMTLQLADNSVSTQRESELRRAYQRELNHKPTVVQRTLIRTAAVMQARFEAALLDPSTTANDLVRLSGEARRSRIDMLAAFSNGRKPEQHALTLGELLRYGA